MRKTRLALVSAAALLVVVLAVVGAYWFTGSAATKPNIVVVLPSDRNPFWIEVRRGAEKAALELTQSASVQIAASNDQDATSQNAILATFFARKQAAALVIGPADDHATVPRLAEFLRAKIPVIVIDTELDKKALAEQGVTPTAFLGSSNRDGGEKAAREMTAAVAKKGSSKRVLLIEGSFVHQSAIDRTEGFLKIAKETGLEVERVRADWKKDLAQEFVASRFAREQYAGIFANNDDMALGAVTALKALRTTTERWPVIIGFDATKDALAAIAAGEMYASVRQDAGLMGYEGVQSALKAIRKDSTLRPHRLLEVHIVPAR